MRDFRKLDVWSASIDFVSVIYELTTKYPDHEKFGVISQMRRAAISIPSNIAEGCSRRTSAEFARFIEIALGSAFELETQIIVTHKLNYISAEKCAELLAVLQIQQRKLNALRSSILDN